MERHRFMLDLLHPDNTIEYVTQLLTYKRELTDEDLTKIIEAAEVIKEAATIRKSSRIQ